MGMLGHFGDRVVVFKLPPVVRTAIHFFGELAGAFLLIVIAAFVLSVASQRAIQYLNLFPETITGSAAERLLSAIINIDGILLGFIALVYTSMLSSLESRRNQVIDIFARRQDNTDEPPNKAVFEGMRNTVERRRNDMLFLMIIVMLSLLGSVLWAIMRLSTVEAGFPRAELSYLIGPFVAAVLAFMASIWLYTR